MRVNANGGTPVPITKIDRLSTLRIAGHFFFPTASTSSTLAMHHDPSKSANNMLYYASLDGRENRPLFRSQSNAVYADGFLLFARGESVDGATLRSLHGNSAASPELGQRRDE